jgi:hypothetical protein
MTDRTSPPEVHSVIFQELFDNEYDGNVDPCRLTHVCRYLFYGLVRFLAPSDLPG